MNHADDWRLTIHYWPRAVAAGVHPQPCPGFNFDDSPSSYHPHEIDFSHPPSREDFLAVVGATPWMNGWSDNLLPVVCQNQWPMIAPGHKGSTVNLKDSNEASVGRLEVWRHQRYCNTPYSIPMLGTYPGSEIDRFLNRRIRDQVMRDQARQQLDAHRNLILERLAASSDQSNAQMLDEVERVLRDVGILRSAKRKPLRIECVATPPFTL